MRNAIIKFELISFFLIISSSISAAPMGSQQQIQNQLYKFHANPARFMDELPPKVDLSGESETPLFETDAIRTKDYILAKDQQRVVITKNLKYQNRDSRLEPFDSNDLQLRSFFEGLPVYTNLETMDQLGYRQGQVRRALWSGYSWPYYLGGMAQRYNDRSFPKSRDWLTNFNYFLNQNPLAETDITRLSPAEKYDLIVGDEALTLSRAMWAAGQFYYERDGRLERWFGYCHGWSVATLNLSAPSRYVDVMSYDRTKVVRFYPVDIKALAGLLWANGQFPTRFVGGRCNIKSPKRDENGRIVEPQCRDTNPAVWHLALVHRVQNNLSFVFDATYDYEVWNQPVVSYKYSYFNPVTLKNSDSLAESKVDIDRFSNDKFRRYRSKQARYVVGVALDLQYLNGVLPKAREVETDLHNSYRRVQYLYDLELDESGNIIGGEWYTHRHPDFIWASALGTRIQTDGDLWAEQENWSVGSPVPGSWREGARVSSSKAQPLTRLVEELVRRSSM